MSAENNLPHVVVLGAGPAGVGAAFQLTRMGKARVTMLEQNPVVGGNAGSFDLAGLRVDFGSHRLHPACEPHILQDLKNILGEDLLDRPRHGRIRLQGRWIHFPLKPVDLILRLPPPFAMGVLGDMARKVLPKTAPGEETFATILERGLGRTICREFYFPYARKLWGLAPEELSVTQAKRRVSGSSLGKMIRKVASAIPGLKPPGAGRFFYPRRGYGQISERLAEVAQERGAEFLFGARVKAVECEGGKAVAVRYEHGGQEQTLRAAHIWSTLPVSLLARGIRPGAPAEVIEAAGKMSFRGMILIYLVLETEQFTEYDAHYFPESAIAISRLSEPKNYCAANTPRGLTVLCAEFPCDPGTKEWDWSDEQLGQMMRDALDRAGIPVRVPVRQVMTRKLRQAYPMYVRGYDEHFAKIDNWLQSIEGLLTFGRQGLFAHDNTHHALFMAYSAVDCLSSDGRWDAARWREFRKVFETHVVED